MNGNRQGNARRGRNRRTLHTRNFTCRVLLSKLSDETVLEINNRRYCQLCHRSPSDPLLYGKIYNLGQVTVHYYCLLFACHLGQNGEDEEGIHGFLEHDIFKEIKRAQSVLCSYCGEGGASIVCVQRMCKKVFHLPCGLENGSQHNYYDKFQSFCKQHRPVIRVLLTQVIDPEPAFCAICMDEVKKEIKCLHAVWAPCCKKNSWLHRTCVQKYALSAGYFFKCPKCNNSNEFIKAMKRYGIYIPERDAAWETEGDQFAGLYRRHHECNAPLCLCPNGKSYDEEDSEWEIALCDACASEGIHIGCTPYKTALRKWFCQGCKPFMQSRKEDPGTSALLRSLASVMPNPNLDPGSSHFPELPPSPPPPPPIETESSEVLPSPGPPPESSSILPPQVPPPTPPPPTTTNQLPSTPSSTEDSVLQMECESEEVDVEILDDLDELQCRLRPIDDDIQELYPPVARHQERFSVRKKPKFTIILDDDDDDDGGDADDDPDDMPKFIGEICKLD